MRTIFAFFTRLFDLYGGRRGLRRLSARLLQADH
jgi:hypothetical protein